MHYFAKQSKTGVAHQKQRVMCYTQSYAIQSKTEENRSGTPDGGKEPLNLRGIASRHTRGILLMIRNRAFC